MTVLSYTLVAATVTGLLSVLRAGDADVPRRSSLDALRNRMPSTFSVRGMAGRVSAGALLVVAEIALAMAVPIGGGLACPELREPGRRTAWLRTVACPDVSGGDAGRPLQGPADSLFAEDLVARLRQAPGITAAAYAPLLPMVNLLQHSAGFEENRQESPSRPSPRTCAVSAGTIFKSWAYGCSLDAAFPRPDQAGQPRVVVISRSLARRDFPGEDAARPDGLPAGPERPVAGRRRCRRVRQVALRRGADATGLR